MASVLVKGPLEEDQARQRKYMWMGHHDAGITASSLNHMNAGGGLG
jgi:hypothetical protein